jgi:hypothetical protein
MKRRKRVATVVAVLGIGVWLALPGTAAARTLPGAAAGRTYPYVPANPAASVIVTIPIDGPDSVGDGLALEVVSWSD